MRSVNKHGNTGDPEMEGGTQKRRPATATGVKKQM